MTHKHPFTEIRLTGHEGCIRYYSLELHTVVMPYSFTSIQWNLETLISFAVSRMLCEGELQFIDPCQP